MPVRQKVRPKPCPLFTSALRQSSTDTNIFFQSFLWTVGSGVFYHDRKQCNLQTLLKRPLLSAYRYRQTFWKLRKYAQCASADFPEGQIRCRPGKMRKEKCGKNKGRESLIWKNEIENNIQINFHRLTPVVLSIPNFKRPARSYASLTAGLVCLHLSADADVRIIKNGIQKVYLSRLSLRNIK